MLSPAFESISQPVTITRGRMTGCPFSSAAGQTIATATTAIVDFGTKVYNTHDGSVVTGASWKYIAQISGKFSVATRMRWASTAWAALGNNISTFLYKNGSEYSYLDNLHTSGTTAKFGNGYDEVYLLAGEYIDIRASHDEAGSKSLDANANRLTVSI